MRQGGHLSVSVMASWTRYGPGRSAVQLNQREAHVDVSRHCSVPSPASTDHFSLKRSSFGPSGSCAPAAKRVSGIPLGTTASSDCTAVTWVGLGGPAFVPPANTLILGTGASISLLSTAVASTPSKVTTEARKGRATSRMAHGCLLVSGALAGEPSTGGASPVGALLLLNRRCPRRNTAKVARASARTRGGCRSGGLTPCRRSPWTRNTRGMILPQTKRQPMAGLR